MTYTPLTIPTLPTIYAGYTMTTQDMTNLIYACNFLLTKPLTRAYDATGGQTIAIAPATPTVINFTEIQIDIDGMWSNSAPSRLTIQTPGWYKVRYGINAGSTTNCSFNGFATVNAGPQNPGGPGSLNIYGSSSCFGSFNFLSAAGIVPTYLWQGDYITLNILTSTNQSLHTSVTGYQGSNNAGSFLCLEYVSIT